MESPELAPSLESERLCVLVVEDEFIVRYGISDELRDAGFKVVEANSADEAWKYLMAGGKTDLIFSDIQMPGSMNGIELMQRVHERFAGIPVILTSGNVGPDKVNVAARFIPKPYRIAEVVSLIEKTLVDRR